MRHADWRARLAATVEHWRRQPFVFGRTDCALFASDCITALTGMDPAAPYRGRYGTADEGQALLQRNGFSSLLGLASTIGKIVPVREAVYGDIGLVANADRFEHSFCLVNGETVLAVRPNGGLGVGSRQLLLIAFRIE